MNNKEQLKEHLSSKTKLNYSNVINRVGKILYNNDYIESKQHGGDGGIDARLSIGDKKYYIAIGGEATTKDIEDKILSDSKKIKQNLIQKNQWEFDAKDNNKILFITQTFDDPLPNSVQNRYKEFSQKLKNNIGEIDYEILNAEMLLNKFDESQIEELYKEIFSEEKIFEQIDTFIQHMSFTSGSSYERKSTEEKIKKNNLLNLKEFIDKGLLDLTFVTEFEKWLEFDISHNIKFIQLKDYIKKIYDEQKKLGRESVVIFNNIIEILNGNSALTKENSTKLVIYVFDMCDIF